MQMNPLYLPPMPAVEFDSPCLMSVAELEAAYPGYSYPIDEFDTLDDACRFPGGHEAWARFQRRRERERQAAAELSALSSVESKQ
jgi:hypothetical protein